jgi:phosphatidylglycerol---prolipoprotein diacylglyceryl transferase
MDQHHAMSRQSVGGSALKSPPPQPTAQHPLAPGMRSLMETAAQEVLAPTFWFEPAQRPDPYPVIVRFSGRRTDVVGEPTAADRFMRDELIAAVVPGSGPIAVTPRIQGINAGSWVVTAQIQGPQQVALRRRARGSVAREALVDASNASRASFLPTLWRRWIPGAGESYQTAEPIPTRLAPFIRIPGMLPLGWVTFVTAGMAVALATQYSLATRAHLAANSMFLTTLPARMAGSAGAKGWYVFKHRRTHRWDGWCIQGFVAAASLVALLIFTARHQPTTANLDATAPGLLFGMAIGRVGCFFAGCCGGPPTASRWGVWSSDQRVGARRVPTQLLEAALAFGSGLFALALFVAHGPLGGAHFAGALAAYTLARQGILRLRAEPQQTRMTVPLTTAASAAMLAIATVATVVAITGW